MYLSKSKKSKIWQVYYRKENGKKTRISTGSTNKSEAYKFLNEFEKKVKERQNKTDISLGELAEKQLKILSVTNTKYSYYLAKHSINNFLDYAGKETLISKVDKALAESFILKIYENAKHSAALKLRHLKAMFNKAIEWNYILINPFKGIRLRIPQSFPAFVNSDELKAILEKEIEILFKRIYQTAFLTGMRIGEILDMQWENVDLSTKEIIVKNKKEFTTKGKKERLIPINQTLLEILINQKKESSNQSTEYVFNKNGVKLNVDYVSKRFKKVVKKTDLNQSLHFHSLRHSFCSNLASKGVSLYVIKTLAGHESIVTTQRYSHLKKENLEQAINLLS